MENLSKNLLEWHEVELNLYIKEEQKKFEWF